MIPHEEFLSLQPMFPPKSLDKFFPEYGCSEGLDDVHIFLKRLQSSTAKLYNKEHKINDRKKENKNKKQRSGRKSATQGHAEGTHK